MCATGGSGAVFAKVAARVRLCDTPDMDNDASDLSLGEPRSRLLSPFLACALIAVLPYLGHWIFGWCFGPQDDYGVQHWQLKEGARYFSRAPLIAAFLVFMTAAIVQRCCGTRSRRPRRS